MIYNSNFHNAMMSPIKELFIKLEFYNYKNEYLFEYSQRVTDNIGSLTLDSESPIKRNLTLNLDNSDGFFNFGERNILWIDKRMKMYIGLKYNSEIVYIPQGVYVLTEPINSHDSDGAITKITCVDKMYFYVDSRGKFNYETTIETGAKITDVIKLLASKVGETLFNFDDIADKVPYTFTYQPSDNIYNAVSELAEKANCRIYYDENGYLRLKKVNLNDFSSYPSVWSFHYGGDKERFYAGSARRLDTSNISNHIFVLGGSSDVAESRYELKVTETDPLWRESPYSIEKIGSHIYFHNNGNPDSLLESEPDCKNRAKWELMNRLGYTERVSLQCSPVWSLDILDIIEIIDEKNSVNGRYLIDSITIPLSPELMSIECRKERKIIDNWDFI